LLLVGGFVGGAVGLGVLRIAGALVLVGGGLVGVLRGLLRTRDAAQLVAGLLFAFGGEGLRKDSGQGRLEVEAAADGVAQREEAAGHEDEGGEGVRGARHRIWYGAADVGPGGGAFGGFGLQADDLGQGAGASRRFVEI